MLSSYVIFVKRVWNHSIHLFIHCKVAKQCWELFLNLCCVVWVMPSDVRSLLESWNGQKITSIQKQFWKTIPGYFLDHFE